MNVGVTGISRKDSCTVHRVIVKAGLDVIQPSPGYNGVTWKAAVFAMSQQDALTQFAQDPLYFNLLGAANFEQFCRNERVVRFGTIQGAFTCIEEPSTDVFCFHASDPDGLFLDRQRSGWDIRQKVKLKTDESLWLLIAWSVLQVFEVSMTEDIEARCLITD